MAQLGGVDQALAQARAQVSAMTKQHLEELRTMNNPPAIVKFCLEAVSMLLVPNESHPMSWENIRFVLFYFDILLFCYFVILF
jgi:hypothetical protein